MEQYNGGFQVAAPFAGGSQVTVYTDADRLRFNSLAVPVPTAGYYADMMAELQRLRAENPSTYITLAMVVQRMNEKFSWLARVAEEDYYEFVSIINEKQDQVEHWLRQISALAVVYLQRVLGFTILCTG